MSQNDKPWNEKVLEALRTTGENVRSEAQRLVNELRDPANHDRVRQGLADLGDWAKKTADDAAKIVDDAAKRVDAVVAAAARRAKAGQKKPAKKKSKSAPAKKKKKKAKR